MPTTATLYPLLFDPIYKEKVWGGRALEGLGRDLPGDATTPIGESWEIADLATTSASGGGGAAEHSVVRNGTLAGTALNALVARHRVSLLGDDVPAGTMFPLLIKYLDAKDNLSVQVHPSPRYAADHPEAYLKSEAWYVVDCDPDAVIYKGLRPDVTADALRAALEANTDDAVVPLLNTVSVKPGDCHYLPSGTCHALGAGVLVAEVQTPSDTTFRVYDWGRTGRELHIEQAIACIDFNAPPATETNAWKTRSTPRDEHTTTTRLVRCPFFQIAHVDHEPGESQVDPVTRPEVWMVLSGTIAFRGPSGETTQACTGQTLLLPPGAGAASVCVHEVSRVLRVTLP